MVFNWLRHIWAPKCAVSPAQMAVLALGLCIMSAPVRADELRILTSMSGQVFEPFKQRFEALNPQTRVIVLNKNTNAALEEVLRGNPRGFDIFWASSPEAFNLLDRYNAFFDTPPCPKIDPNRFSIFALSGLGWSMREDNPLPFPESWNDLLKTDYRGRIGMARPSRSGTTHMLIERFLQVRGWDTGWQYVLALSGNLSTLTSRSFGVPDGVLNRRFDLGLSIDFLAQGAGPELRFKYGQPIMLTPARIGILNTASNVEAGCRFIEYVLSDPGQRLLLDPQMRRVPANPAIRAEAEARIPQAMRDALRLTWMRYNAGVAQSRYWVVNALFDVFVTDVFSRRRALWQRLDALPETTPPRKLATLRTLLTTMPVTEANGQLAGLNEAPFRATNLTANSAAQEAALLRWRTARDAMLFEAETLLAALERDGR